MALDKASPVPLHYQLKQLLVRRIEAGDYDPGQRLPTEDEFCQLYGISRTPVRQALTELEREGWLVRYRRRGTFVRERIAAATLNVLLSERRWVGPLREAVAQLNGAGAEPELDVQFELVRYEELHEQLIGAVARGRGPDVALVDSVWLAELAHLDYLWPLAELAPRWVADVLADSYPPFAQGGADEEACFGLQPEADVSLIWYRRDWFEAEGVAPPRSWRALVEAAAHFQKPSVRRRYGNGPYPLAFAAGRAAKEATVYQFSSFVWATGGALWVPERGDLGPGTRRALRFWQDLVHRHGVAAPELSRLPWGAPYRRLAQGEAALAVGGSYERAWIQEHAGWRAGAFERRVGFVPIPGERAGQTGTTVGGMAFCVLRQAGAPRAAVRMLQQALAPASLTRFFEAHPGHCPTRRSVVRALKGPSQHVLRALAALLAEARPRPALPDYAKVSHQLQRMVEGALERRWTVAEAVAKAEEIIEALARDPR